MGDILASFALGNGLGVHIATLSRRTVDESGANHLGYTGYFLFEANDTEQKKGINILGKLSSLEAAFRLIELWSNRSEFVALEETEKPAEP